MSHHMCFVIHSHISYTVGIYYEKIFAIQTILLSEETFMIFEYIQRYIDQKCVLALGFPDHKIKTSNEIPLYGI